MLYFIRIKLSIYGKYGYSLGFHSTPCEHKTSSLNIINRYKGKNRPAEKGCVTYITNIKNSHKITHE